MLDQKSHKSHFNGLVLPHLDYADIVWDDQPGWVIGGLLTEYYVLFIIIINLRALETMRTNLSKSV